MLHRTGRTYCSLECRDAWVSQDSSKRMARTNRSHASARMRQKNPMHSDEVRERMAATLRSIGHRPQRQGGNGRGPTEPQHRLARELGWPTEVIVPTKMPRGGGYPTHYKIDIAHLDHQIAIEVDGSTHHSLVGQARDAKKDEFLSGLGWTVLRFSNQDVMEHLADCVQTVRSTTLK